MKYLFAAACILAAISQSASAQSTVRVQGHIRKDGTYVPPHTRTAPNTSRTDNWSSSPNVNPYNGKQGTVDPYAPKPPAKKSCAGWGC